MKNYKYIIFDFDGTVNDTSEGIYHTFKKVLGLMGVSDEGIDFSRHIGPPLEFSYTELVGAERCQQGIELHRKVFVEDNAVQMSRLYYGIVQTLTELKRRGYVLAIASSKYQPHAVDSIKNFHLDGLFSFVYGQNEKRGFKTEVLRQLIDDNGWNREQCLMIGDTPYDIDGAHENGVDAMAVTYGFGAKTQLLQSCPEMVANSPQEILQLLTEN